MPRLAKSLATLRDQINARWPNRSKVSDGWIGDSTHAVRESDHNPNQDDIVTALDITHDPANGPDTWALAETLRVNRDPRIKYVISNRRIFSSLISPWQWRSYSGSNKHAHHIHVSVVADPARYDDAGGWRLDAPDAATASIAKPPRGITTDMRRRMATAIADFEARRVNGKLAIYRLPANDGGGAYEVAGINVRYHPQQAAKLKALIEAGRHDEADAAVIDYLLSYTNVAAGWTDDAGAEFYLRDCVFNRGPKGAARILQRSVGVPDDGEVGTVTRAAMAAVSRADLLTRLRAGREAYERDVVGYRANFWKGLVNRWDKALVTARAFQKEQGALIPPAMRPVGVGVGVAALLGAIAAWLGARPAAIVIGAILSGIAIVALIEYRKRTP